MSDLPYELHEETVNDIGLREHNGFTRFEIVAYAIAKEISLGRLILPVPSSIDVALPQWTATSSAESLPPVDDVTYVAGTSEPLSDLDASVGEPPKPEPTTNTANQIWPKRRHR